MDKLTQHVPRHVHVLPGRRYVIECTCGIVVEALSSVAVAEAFDAHAAGARTARRDE